MCAITLLCFVCYKNRIVRVYLNFFNQNPHWLQFIPIPHNKLRDAINPHLLHSHKTSGRILTSCWRAQGGNWKGYYYSIGSQSNQSQGLIFSALHVSPLQEHLICISAKRQKTSTDTNCLWIIYFYPISYISFEQCHPLKKWEVRRILTLIRMTKDEKGLAFFKGLLL